MVFFKEEIDTWGDFILGIVQNVSEFGVPGWSDFIDCAGCYKAGEGNLGGVGF